MLGGGHAAGVDDTVTLSIGPKDTEDRVSLEGLSEVVVACLGARALLVGHQFERKRVFEGFLDVLRGKGREVKGTANPVKVHVMRSGGLFSVFDQFYLIALWGVNESKATTGAIRGAVRKGIAQGGGMSGKRLEVIDFESEVCEVGAEGDWAAGGVGADLDEFLAIRRAKEDELGATGGLVATDLVETEHLGVEGDGLFEVIDAVTGMQELFDFHRGVKRTVGSCWAQWRAEASRRCRGLAVHAEGQKGEQANDHGPFKQEEVQGVIDGQVQQDAADDGQETEPWDEQHERKGEFQGQDRPCGDLTEEEAVHHELREGKAMILDEIQRVIHSGAVPPIRPLELQDACAEVDDRHLELKKAQGPGFTGLVTAMTGRGNQVSHTPPGIERHEDHEKAGEAHKRVLCVTPGIVAMVKRGEQDKQTCRLKPPIKPEHKAHRLNDDEREQNRDGDF